MALVVNADDFGLSEDVSRAIAECFEKGIVQRTTFMVNMPYARQAMELAKEAHFSDCVGLHLNLTSGKPLTDDIARDPLMCSLSGEFSGDFARNLRTRFFIPRSTQKKVEEEIRAQLDMFRDLGGTLWHIDSHHHVHTDPSIWRILKRVLHDYPVTSVRLGRNMFRGGNVLNHIYKAILNRSIRKYCKVRQDYFGSAADYEAFTERDVKLSQRCEVEVMVHPVYTEEGKPADKISEGFRELTVMS